jgi:hypothetical protein
LEICWAITANQGVWLECFITVLDISASGFRGLFLKALPPSDLMMWAWRPFPHRAEAVQIRSWTDDELGAFEARWSIGTKQRTAYALILYAGSARVDVHRMTWRQIDSTTVGYTRNKTGVDVTIGVHDELNAVLAATPRTHSRSSTPSSESHSLWLASASLSVMPYAKLAYLSTANHMAYARPLVVVWPTPAVQRTRSWLLLVTKRLRRLSATPEKLIVVVVVAAQLPSCKVSRLDRNI